MFVSVPLSGPPHIVQAGLSLHGHLRRERFIMHNVWGLHVYFYSGKLRCQGEEFSIATGSASITPPNTDLEWEFPDHAPHYYVHFIPSANIRIEEGKQNEPLIWNFPVMNGPFEYFDSLVCDMEMIGATYQTEPLKASVCLWSLLWKISEGDVHQTKEPEKLPSSVQIALSYINQHYSTPIVIKELAKHSGGLGITTSSSCSRNTSTARSKPTSGAGGASRHNSCSATPRSRSSRLHRPWGFPTSTTSTRRSTGSWGQPHQKYGDPRPNGSDPPHDGCTRSYR